MTDNKCNNFHIDPVKWGKLCSKIDEMHEDVKETKVDVKRQNGRVRKLEINQGKLFAGVSIFAVVVSVAIKVLF